MLGIARERPLAVFVDNFHRVDSTTLGVLIEVADHIPQLPVALVVSTHPGAVAAARGVARLSIHAVSTVVRLDPLPTADVETLARSRGLQPEPDFIEVLQETCAGDLSVMLEVLDSAGASAAQLAAAGHTNREIAAELFVSVKTVEYHVSNTYAKLRIRSRRELRKRL